MASRTYTTHGLTDPMLRRLNAICHGRQVGGLAMVALKRRGMVTESGSYLDGDHKWIATDAGQAALIVARAEGW